jgi:hypothetical protein
MDAAIWRKSSRSADDGGNCVEVASLPGAVGVRDSKDPDGPKLMLSQRAWRMLVRDLRG